MHFLQGLMLGLAYVAPIGLQNIFVINMALTQSRGRAFAAALITICFDVSLALACFFGVGVLMEHFVWLKLAVLGVGSVLVIVIGAKLLKDRTQVEGLASGDAVDDDASARLSEQSLLKIAGQACLFTWFNPQALLDGTMMLGAFKATLPAAAGVAFILGVACASCCWFLGITFCVRLFHNLMTPKVLRVVNVVCGIVIIIYGAMLAVQFLQAVPQIF